jgi:tRNA A-37 threonylcarbamoyl transferase component Bud32
MTIALALLASLIGIAAGQVPRQPVPRPVVVVSSPPGASVYGQDYVAATGRGYLGKTPLRLVLDDRLSHELYLALDGYATQHVRVEPAQARVEVTLTPSTPWSWLLDRVARAPLLIGLLAVVGLGLCAWAVAHYLRLRRIPSAVAPALEIVATPAPPRIGEYELIEPLGEGADASVYRARHVDLHDIVALKVLKTEGVDEEGLGRFQREVEIGRDIRHPNLARVYAFGEDEGRPYIAMELVEGETLQARLDGPPLMWGEAIAIALEVCAGLSACHEAGIVHRDLKPTNIMLTRSGGVRLLDFGIARRLDRRRLTATGAPLGTPMYVAPEQVRGKPDARADLYSLGVILFEAMSGQPPFDADDPIALMMAHCSEPAPKLQSVAPNVPTEVCAVVDRLLEKSPSRRIQTARELSDLLQGLLAVREVAS